MLIRLRPLGALRMRDGGAADETIIGVPADDVDPTCADLPQIERDRIEAFFRVYKDLPEGRNPVQLNGWGNAAEAKVLITQAMQRFDAQRARARGD